MSNSSYIAQEGGPPHSREFMLLPSSAGALIYLQILLSQDMALHQAIITKLQTPGTLPKAILRRTKVMVHHPEEDILHSSKAMAHHQERLIHQTRDGTVHYLLKVSGNSLIYSSQVIMPKRLQSVNMDKRPYPHPRTLAASRRTRYTCQGGSSSHHGKACLVRLCQASIPRDSK
jgi:hypothetical protein